MRSGSWRSHPVEGFGTPNDPMVLTSEERHRLVEWTRAARDLAGPPIRDDLAADNRNLKLFIWARTAGQILESIQRFSVRTSHPELE